MNFKKLSNKLIKDWTKIANNCKYSWHTLIDTVELDNKIKYYNSFNLIIYKEKLAIAIFSSEKIITKKYGFSMNILKCEYDGLFIHDDYVHYENELKKFFSEKIISNFFKKKLKIDRIDHCPPPPAILEKKNLLKNIDVLYHTKSYKEILGSQNKENYLGDNIIYNQDIL